ncbi:MAG: hypothetical protein ACI8ZB_003805 [Desulforhopalus sp.]|jgi:hypothetical protein
MTIDSPHYDCEDEYDFEQDYELEYALDKEENLIKGRSYYEYGAKQKRVKNESSPEISPEATSASPTETPPPIVETPENVDELLPSLDLLGLFDDESEVDNSGLTEDDDEPAASLLELDLSDFDEKVDFPIAERENQDSLTDFSQPSEVLEPETTSSLEEESDVDNSGLTEDDNEPADSVIELDLSDFAEEDHFQIEEIENQDSSTDLDQPSAVLESEITAFLEGKSEVNDPGVTGDDEEAAESVIELDLSDFDVKVDFPIEETENQVSSTDFDQLSEVLEPEANLSLEEESEVDDSSVTADDDEPAESEIELELSDFAEEDHVLVEEIENQDSSIDFDQPSDVLDPETSSSLDEIYESEDFFAEEEKKNSFELDDHSEMYFDSDDDEYDLTWADGIHVDVGGKLTQEDRAWQVAMEVAGEYELDQVETESLAEIFISKGWSACRIAMERELSLGTSLEELRLAAEVKEVWEEYPEFYNEFETAYRIMSWPLALSILRSFEGYPAIEEIEQMLLRLFEHWRKDKISTLIFRTFLEYLYDKFGPTKDCSEFLCEWKVEDAKFVEDSNFFPPRSQDIPPLINSFTPDKWLANVRRYNSY